jgi:hypothetical protein
MVFIQSVTGQHQPFIKLGYPVVDIQAFLRHESAKTKAKYIKSIGSEGVRSAREAFSKEKGVVLVFKPREMHRGEHPAQKEKAVSRAVNS